MTDVANELEAIYDALSSSVASADQRNAAYQAFESLKKQDESFHAAREVIRRRKSEGSVYTALLVIEHHINNNWRRISEPQILEHIIDAIEKASELSTNLTVVGAANVGFATCLHNSRFLENFFLESSKKSLACAEIFFLIVDRLALTVTDYCKNFPNHIRQDLRAFFIKQAGRIFSEAYDKINFAYNENEPNSARIICSIFGAVSQLLSSELSLIRDIIKNEDLCKRFISLAYLLLDKYSHKYHESVITFLKSFSEKILMIVTNKSPVSLFISDDKLLTLSNFIKSCSTYPTRYEGALFFNCLTRMLIDSSDRQSEMYPQYVFEVISSLVVYSEPSINVTCARILHIYALGLFRSHKPIYYQYYDNIVELYFKIAINHKKGEYTVNYNSIQEDNLSLKESETIIYRFAISIFTSDQIKVMLVTSKFATKVINSFLYEESMSVVECSGIAFGLKNISSVSDNSVFTNMLKKTPSKSYNYPFDNTRRDSEDFEDLLTISLDLLTKLINAPIKTLRQFNCFLDLSLSILNHFYCQPKQLDLFLRTLHGHCLGFIHASKEYHTLNLDSIYWLRRSNKALTILLKTIWQLVKEHDKESDVYLTFAAIVSDVALNLCILDWVEKDHLDNYFFIQSYKADNNSQAFNFFINIIKTYFNNQILISGINNTDRFLEVFSIGDDTIRPDSYEPLKQLFQLISLVAVFYNDLKTHESVNLKANPIFPEICKLSLDVYALIQKIWKCYCGIFDNNVEARRSPQLLRAIGGLHLKMIECSYEQKFTSFENLEHRIYLLGKNLIGAISSLFVINMKYFSDTSVILAKSFLADIWKPFLYTPFILIPFFTNSIFISYVENVKEPLSHKIFIEGLVVVFDDLSKIISNRCSAIRKQLDAIEQSSFTEEGNDIVEASNVTDDVLFALCRLCFRFLDVSTFGFLDIARVINENTEPEPSMAAKFECIAYTNHVTWISLMKLSMTLISFGNSKLITRVCNNNFFDNQIKLRLNHIENNPNLYSTLVTQMFTSLYNAYKNKEIYYQAGITVVNMLIYVINSFKNIYPGIGALLQQITAYQSSQTINQTLNLLSQSNISLKEKRQAMIRILDRVTDENENINLLMNEFENFSVAKTDTVRCKYDVEYKALSDSDLVDIRFLFE